MAAVSLQDRPEILFSPNSNSASNSRFLVVTNDRLKLFEAYFDGSDDFIKSQSSLVSKNTQFKLIKEENDSEGIKCISWQANSEESNQIFFSPDHLIAIGRGSGKVNLLSLLPISPNEDQLGLHKKVLKPRLQRETHFVMWNPWKKSLLAQGLDKNRQQGREPVLLIWDVSRSDDNTGSYDYGDTVNILSNPTGLSKAYGSSSFFYQTQPLSNFSNIVSTSTSSIAGVDTSSSAYSTLEKPLAEYGSGPNDTIHGFAWLTKELFAVGMNGKFLRVYDLIDPSKPLKETTTKAIHGIKLSLRNDKCYFASFGEKTVSIWDYETLEKPIINLSQPDDILLIEWCPKRPCLLGVLLRDSDRVRVYDINTLVSGDTFDEEHDQTLIMRTVRGSVNQKIGSFKWFCDQANALLLLDYEEKLDIGYLRERPAISWNPSQILAVSNSFHNILLHSASGRLSGHATFFEKDICQLMMSRARAGYGSQTMRSLYQIKGKMEGSQTYSQLLASDSKLCEFWKWLEKIQTVFWDSTVKGKNIPKAGVQIVNNNAAATTPGSNTSHRTKKISGSGGGYAPTATSSGPGSASSDLSPSAVPSGSTPSPSYPTPATQTITVPLSLSQWAGVMPILTGSGSGSGSSNSSVSPKIRPQNTPVVFNSETVSVNNLRWDGPGKPAFPLKQYRSELRSNILRFCLWPVAKDQISSFVEDVYTNNEVDRAAALALFHLRFTSSHSYLKNAAGNLRLNEARGQISYFPSTDLEKMYLCMAGFVSNTINMNNISMEDTTTSRRSTLHSNNPSITSNLEWNSLSDWESMCEDVVARLSSPYLRAMFNFLSAKSSNDLSAILDSPGIKLVDQVALACLYLDDDELKQRLQNYLDKSLKEGRLMGVVLTGLGTPQFLQLLQSYLDATDDVQTVSIVLLHAIQLGNTDLSSYLPAYHWVLNYRDLLDRWTLWFHRAEFDIAHHGAMNHLMKDKPFDNTTMACQVFVSCYYCGHRISQHHNMTSNSSSSSRLTGVGGAQTGTPKTPGTGNKVGGSFFQQSQQRIPGPAGAQTIGQASTMLYNGGHTQATGGKVTVCQQCRKALPRCSVCLMYMGTGSGMWAGPKPPSLDKSKLLNPTAGLSLLTRQNSMVNSDERRGIPPPYPTNNWFTWCQDCRHGGHASHLVAWFQEFSVCPVSGCKCRCIVLDEPLLAATRDPELPQRLLPSNAVKGQRISACNMPDEQFHFTQMAAERINTLIAKTSL